MSVIYIASSKVIQNLKKNQEKKCDVLYLGRDPPPI